MGAYRVYNGPMPTTAAFASVSTGTSIKTMLQLATPSDMQIRLISWGFTISEPAGAIGEIELLQTDVAATVTAHVSSGIISTDPNAAACRLTLGTSATGYSASAEGSTTATRTFDVVRLPTTAAGTPMEYVYQWMPDERPIVAVSKFLRVRATTPTSGVNMVTWVSFLQM